MPHQIIRNQSNSFLSSDHSFQRRPFALEPLLLLNLFALSRFFKVFIEMRPLVRVQRQLRQTALVINLYRRSVFHSPLDVIYRDVIAKDRARVRIFQLNRRAGKTDERSIRQGVAHVPGKAVNKVILGAMRFVGNDDDVASFGKRRINQPLLLREELLHGRKDDAA